MTLAQLWSVFIPACHSTGYCRIDPLLQAEVSSMNYLKVATVLHMLCWHVDWHKTDGAIYALCLRVGFCFQLKLARTNISLFIPKCIIYVWRQSNLFGHYFMVVCAVMLALHIMPYLLCNFMFWRQFCSLLLCSQPHFPSFILCKVAKDCIFMGSKLGHSLCLKFPPVECQAKACTNNHSQRVASCLKANSRRVWI